jgi:hypothetical protein
MGRLPCASAPPVKDPTLLPATLTLAFSYPCRHSRLPLASSASTRLSRKHVTHTCRRPLPALFARPPTRSSSSYSASGSAHVGDDSISVRPPQARPSRRGNHEGLLRRSPSETRSQGLCIVDNNEVLAACTPWSPHALLPFHEVLVIIKPNPLANKPPEFLACPSCCSSPALRRPRPTLHVRVAAPACSSLSSCARLSPSPAASSLMPWPTSPSSPAFRLFSAPASPVVSPSTKPRSPSPARLRPRRLRPRPYASARLPARS